MTWSIADYNATPSSNSNINGINIAEGCAASGVNNAIRQLMADLAANYFALAGTVKVNVAVGGASDATLTPTQYNANILEFTGAVTANHNVIFPAQTGLWFIRNKTTGGKTLTMTMGSGVTVPAPATGNFVLLSDGTDMFVGETTVPTPAANDNSQLIANTAWVTAAINTAKATIQTSLNSIITSLENETNFRTSEDTNLQNQINALPKHMTAGNVGDFLLFEDQTTYTYNTNVSGPTIGQASGTTWKCLGGLLLNSNGNFRGTLFVRET